MYWVVCLSFRPQQAWNVPQWEHPRPSHEEVSLSVSFWGSLKGGKRSCETKLRLVLLISYNKFCFSCMCYSTIKALIMRTTVIGVTRLRPTVTLITSRPGQNIYPPAGTRRTDSTSTRTRTREESMHTQPQVRTSPTPPTSPLGTGRSRTRTLITLFITGQFTRETRPRAMESRTTSETASRWMSAADLYFVY